MSISFYLSILSKIFLNLEIALWTLDSSLWRYKDFRNLLVNDRRHRMCVSPPGNVRTRRWGCSPGSLGWPRYSSGCEGRGLESSGSLSHHCSPSKPCHKLNEKQNCRLHTKNELSFALTSLKSIYIKISTHCKTLNIFQISFFYFDGVISISCYIFAIFCSFSSYSKLNAY